MATYTKQQLLAKIEELGLKSEERAEILNLINQAIEVNDELVALVKEKIQSVIDDTFAAHGVADIEDADYKKHLKTMLAEIDGAQKDYDKEMTKINKDADKLQSNASEQLDDIQMQSVKDQISGI